MLQEANDLSLDQEFWIMSIYLPFGIGAYQAQNQRLLVVSTEQNILVQSEELLKTPILHRRNMSVLRPTFWVSTLKDWWFYNSRNGRYAAFLLGGMFFQVGVRKAPNIIPETYGYSWA